MDAPVTFAERSCASVRSALQLVRAHSATELSVAEKPWWYDCDDAIEYFERFETDDLLAARDDVRGFLTRLRSRGKDAVYVDLCGRAVGGSLAANKSYNFSIQPICSAPIEGVVRVCGDFYSAKHFSLFTTLLAQRGDYPAFVSFDPVAGLLRYWPRGGTPEDSDATYKAVVKQRVLNNLRRIALLLRPGGYLLASHPFQDFLQLPSFRLGRTLHPDDPTPIIGALVASLGYEMRVLSSSTRGPRWLIRRPGGPQDF